MEKSIKDSITLTQEELGFLLDSHGEDLQKLITLYGIDINKGVFLHGTTGVGKTYSIKPLAVKLGAKKNYISMLTANEIVKEYNRFYNSDTLIGHPLGWKNEYDLIIDDLGDESLNIQVYGNTFKPITDLLIGRYNRLQNKTYITSNLDMLQIANRYNDRVWSRLHQMCNVIRLTGKDYRLG